MIDTTIHGGSQTGLIGVGTVTAASIVINNYPDPRPPAERTDTQALAPCPYPGLAYFRPNDAELFFGRDEAIDKLMAAVARQSLTALVGASGSGKSSVVLAGLAPRLHQNGGWLFSYFRIGHELDRNPFLALARALVPLYVQSKTETQQLVETVELAEKLASGKLLLRQVFAASRKQHAGHRILLIADQFEETFILVEDDAVRNHFIDILLSGFLDPSPSERPDICLVLTLRADFYGRALRYRPLSDALQTHVENLGPMTRAELEAAIAKPAKTANVTFEPGLVQTLLDDVERKPGSLPLLQFALREMWGRQHRGQITRNNYDDIGGVEGALAMRAEAIFTGLTGFDSATQTVDRPQVERDFRLLFTRLVRPGEGQEDTRRVVAHNELGDTAWLLGQRLAGEENRLVVTNAPVERVIEAAPDENKDSRETVELVHEALIRHWPRLVEWIDRDRTLQSWLAQIRSNINVWLENRSDESPLLRGGMLAQGVEWFAKRGNDLNAEEQEYIRASIDLQRREEGHKAASATAELKRQQELTDAANRLAAERRRRLVVATVFGLVSIVFAAIAMVGGYEAFTAKNEADRNATAAYAAKKLADENANVAESATTRAEMAARQAQIERDTARMQLLAMQARRTAVEADNPGGIERAGALALESIGMARKADHPAEADALEAARIALARLPLQVFSHGNQVRHLVVLADGRLASGGDDGQIKLWPRDGVGEPVLLQHGSGVNSLVVLVDGRLASGGDDGLIRLWPRDGVGEPVVLQHGRGVAFLAVLADGRLVSSGEFGQIKLWPRDGMGEPAVLPHAQASARMSLVVLADGRLASGGYDDPITLWPRDGVGEPVSLTQQHSREALVLSLAMLADGRLASGGGDGRIKLWPRDGVGEPMVLSHGSPVWSLVVMADGRLASGGADGLIKLWPRDGVGEPMSLSHGSAVLSLAMRADGRLASGGNDGLIKLWPRDGVGEPMVLYHGSGVWSLVVLADGRLASGGDDGLIKLWPHDGLGEPVVLSHDPDPVKNYYRILPLVVLADGRLASGGSNGLIKLWPRDGVGEPVLLPRAHRGGVSSLVVLVDGRLASGGDDGLIMPWPLDALRNASKFVINPLAHGSGGVFGRQVWSLAMLADGRLASGGDGLIKLWPRDGVGEPMILSHGSRVRSLVTMADGRLASGGFDDQIKLWFVEEQKLLAALCLRPGRNLSNDEWAHYIGPDTPWQPSCLSLGLISNWRTAKKPR